MAGIALAINLLLGGLLASSGLTKLRSGTFIEALANYRLLPIRLVPTVARALPWLELLTGISLVASPWPRVPLVAAASLLIIFSTAVTITLLRGERIPCGCRGSDTTVSWHLVIENLALVAAAIFALRSPNASLVESLAGHHPAVTGSDALAILVATSSTALCLRLTRLWSELVHTLNATDSLGDASAPVTT